MSLITTDYFNLDINVPDVGSTYATISDYIDRYEPEILRKLLGETLYQDVAAYDPLTSSQAIIDLVAGKDYTVGDYTVSWKGLINTDDYISLIAYYVYYWYVRDQISRLSVTGFVSNTHENAQNASPAKHLASVWYKMRELYGYPGQDSLLPSCYNFLSEHEEDYTWDYTDCGTMNFLGI